jgi:D-alanyl-D-alanine carboxypeptidase
VLGTPDEPFVERSMEESTMSYHLTRPVFRRGWIKVVVASLGLTVSITVLASASSVTGRAPAEAERVSPSDASLSLGHFPEAPTDPVPDAIAAALQEVLDAAVDRGLPGIAATVLAPGIGVWSGAAGTADGVRPLEGSSQFAIASITKTVVAAQIMRLAEEGRLALGDPVSDHLPSDFRFDTNGATVADLLAMESGIPDPTLSATAPEVLADPMRDWAAEEVLASVPAQRSPPGDHFVYEDANFMLLGLVIEETTGMSVASALRSGVLADPRLARLVYQPEERPDGPLALPFIGGRVNPDFAAGGGYLPNRSQASNGSGSGGMASDSRALALFGYLLFGGRLLTEDSLLDMTDFGSGADDDRYGLGVFDQTPLAPGLGTTAVGNGGWDDGGYSSVLSALPSEGTVISVLTNTAGSPVDLVFPVAEALAAAVRTGAP